MQIKLKNSVVQDSTPSTSDLPEVGELAVNGNINSIGGFMRASDNTIVKIFGPGSVTTPTATTTVSGISELATNSETTTGSATNRVVTPAGLNAVTVAERSTSNSTYLALAGGTLTGVVAATAGSNSAPSIHFGDSDSGIFGGTNTVSLAAGGTTRLTADTGVSVIGTLAVTGAITSTSDLTIADKIIHAGDTNTAVRFPAADTVSVETGGSERARIDSSGRLLIGTSTSRSVAAGQALLQIENTTTELFSIINTANDNGGSVLAIGKTRNGTIVQNDDTLGRLAFYGDDGNDVDRAAADIMAAVDGTPGTNDMPGRLIFRTTADGGSNPTERLRIDSTGLVKLPDNGKFVAGDSSDLQIYHDSSNSRIHNTTGELIFRTGSNYVFYNSDGSEKHAKFNENGAVELYYDNSKKFETTSTGISVSGSVAADGLAVGDAELATFGNSADLVISHGGTDSTITNNTGQLKIAGDAIRITNAAVSETQALFTANGAVELYHDNTKKFETTSYGNLSAAQVRVASSNASTVAFSVGDVGTGFYNTGSNAIGYSANGTQRWNINSAGDLRLNDNVKLRFGGDNDMNIYHLQGANSYITNTANNLYIQSENGVHIGSIDSNGSNVETSGKFIRNGAVELYYDNVLKFNTTSDGVTISGSQTINGTTIANGHIRVRDHTNTEDGQLMLGTGNDFRLYHDGTNNIILANSGDLNIRMNSSENAIVARQNGAAELYYDNSKKFQTADYGVQTQAMHLIVGAEGGDAQLQLRADEGDDAADKYRLISQASDNTLRIQDIPDGGSWEDKIVCNNNGKVELYFDNSKKVETTTNGIQMTGDIRFDNSTWTGETTNGKIQTHGDHMYFQTAGAQWFFRKNNGTTAASIANNGTYTASDLTFKKDVVTIENPVDTIKKLIGRSFTWKEDNAKSFGVIAQEVETILPELVFSAEEPQGSTAEPKKMVNYPAFTGHFIEAIKELATKIETLESEIAELKAA